VPAPDYAAPLNGWRIWSLVGTPGGFRLCSPYFGTVWQPGLEATATCYRGQWPASLKERFSQNHAAPDGSCRCGIYAVDDAERAARYVSRSGIWLRNRSICSLLGRVALWGTVVEAEHGWRAEHAYPNELYLVEREAGSLVAESNDRDAPTVDRILLALAEYEVPLEVVDDPTVNGLARRLSRPAPADAGTRL
jgi:hypothetical protein